jgi:hypothetical protein
MRKFLFTVSIALLSIVVVAQKKPINATGEMYKGELKDIAKLTDMKQRIDADIATSQEWLTEAKSVVCLYKAERFLDSSNFYLNRAEKLAAQFEKLKAKAIKKSGWKPSKQ